MDETPASLTRSRRSQGNRTAQAMKDGEIQKFSKLSNVRATL